MSKILDDLQKPAKGNPEKWIDLNKIQPKINVLNAGFVQLLDHMGTDDSIVSAARQCYQSKGNTQADEKLLESIVKHRHTSCMEHTALTFKVKCPIFIARQWMRHRVGCSYNEKSLRYCEAEPEFYVPEINVDYEKFDKDDELRITEEIDRLYKYIYNVYFDLVDCGLPKEQSRAVLPIGLYTEFIFSCNMASLFHFLELRLNKAAQAEMQEYAKGLLELTKEVFPKTATEIERQLLSNG